MDDNLRKAIVRVLRADQAFSEVQASGYDEGEAYGELFDAIGDLRATYEQFQVPGGLKVVTKDD